MAHVWRENEEKDEDEELVVTEHRDGRVPAVGHAEEDSIEVPEGQSPREALDAMGEDVASSPARRGREGSEPGES